MIDRLLNLWYDEPARVIAILAAAVVFAATRIGIVVEEQSVTTALLLVLPVLLGGEATRSRVTPE